MDVESPEFLENPYRFYRARRMQSPIFRRNEYIWTITGYKEISKLLASPAAGRGNIGQIPTPHGDTSALDQLKRENPALQILDQWMLFQNPPQHTCIRKQVSDVFTVKVVDQLEPLMRATIKTLIANAQASAATNEFDFVSEIAYPFPLAIVCELIGIPLEDRDHFQKWTKELSVAVQDDFRLLPEEQVDQMNQSAVAIHHYFEKLLPAKKKSPQDDLMSRLLGLGDGNMAETQILANCVFLLFAGQDSTTCLISNAINALIKHPDQLALLGEQPALIDNAVEECLRFDPSIQMVGRLALDDIPYQEITIRRGHHMFIFLGAAGHDPEANPHPERFDISRDKIKHLAFARGAHHCLGASLARLELKVVLEEVLAAFDNLEFTETPQRRNTWLMRGFDSLPIKYHAA